MARFEIFSKYPENLKKNSLFSLTLLDLLKNCLKDILFTKACLSQSLFTSFGLNIIALLPFFLLKARFFIIFINKSLENFKQIRKVFLEYLKLALNI